MPWARDLVRLAGVPLEASADAEGGRAKEARRRLESGPTSSPRPVRVGRVPAAGFRRVTRARARLDRVGEETGCLPPFPRAGPVFS